MLPDISLVTILVISVKMLYPFDHHDQHGRGTAIDWQRWKDARTAHLHRLTASNRLERGTAIRVTEKEVPHLTEEQIDDYLDWFERTWIDPERLQQIAGGKKDNVLGLFPLSSTGDLSLSSNAFGPRMKQEQQSIDSMMRQVVSSMSGTVPRAPATSEDTPEAGYVQYRRQENLSPRARAFHEGVAQIAATRLDTLLVAIFQMEQRLVAWRRTQARDEVLQAEGIVLDSSETGTSSSESGS